MKNAEYQKNTFYPVLLGLLAYYFIVGFKVLDPQYIGWLLGRFDSVQHYLGWVFFRHAAWSNPIGLSPLFGLDISSSIVFADSVPLMAIMLKPFDTLLPSNFQYFGFWLLICFLLQAYFGWKLASIYFSSNLLCLLLTTLFIFSPQLLWRLNTHAGVHNALASHFLILAGIYLVLRKVNTKRFLCLLILFLASLSINFYFLLITSILWFADSIDRYLMKIILINQFLRELLILLIFVLFVAWEVGYFAISASSVDIWGYGFFRFNLLAPIDSYGFSYWLPNMNLPSTWGEGYAYFGIGILLAIFLAIPYLFIGHSQIKLAIKKHPALIVALFLFFFLSITNNIGVGNSSHSIELPEFVLKILGVVHSAARFFWPLYYFLIIFLIFAISKIYPKKISTILIILITILQIVDLIPLYRSIKAEYSKDMTSLIEAPIFSHQLWRDIGKKYQNLVLIPAENQPLNWASYAIYSANYGLGTNSIFTARIDSMKVLKSNEKLNESVVKGSLDVNSFYIVKDSYVLPILFSANQNSIMAKLDKLNVFLPNWKSCIDCPLVEKADLITLKDLTPALNQIIHFSSLNQTSSYYLASGWSWLENWGVWSDSFESNINFPSPPAGATKLTLLIKAFVVPLKKPHQWIEISTQSGYREKIQFLDESLHKIDIPINNRSNSDQLIKVRISIDGSVSPKNLDIGNEDFRKLGIGLISATFR